MKRSLLQHRSCFIIIVLAVLTFMLVNPVFASWYWIHGSSGKIERKDVTDYWGGSSFEYGWGLDIRQKSGTSNWVHFAVPTLGNANKGAKLIQIKFWTGSADAWVSDVHIYNGGTKVKEFKGLWSGSQILTLDLGTVTAFPYGLGISLKINAGEEGMSHRFQFFGAGANFVNK